MKLRVTIVLLCGLTLVAAWLAPLRVGEAFVAPERAMVLRQEGPTVTPTKEDGSGGLPILTATPEQSGLGGLLIPTGTPAGAGGLMIATATPEGATEVFARLSEAQLAELNLQASDVPASFAANASSEVYDSAQTIEGLRDANETALADQYAAIVAWSGLGTTVSTSYSACDPALPVSELYSEVGQLRDVAAARRFVRDPEVLDFFGKLGYQLAPARTVHGIYATGGIEKGECFAQERDYVLMFEYWGLVFWLRVAANAPTDEMLALGLLEQMAPLVVARADQLAGNRLLPTPQPPAGQLTLPSPSPVPSLAPTTSALAIAQQIEATLPSLAEIGLPSPPFQLNGLLSRYYTIAELVSMLQALGLEEVAAATQAGAIANGQSGQVSRVYDTGNTCPLTVPAFSVEIDVAIFATPEGALAQLNDPAIQAAWSRSGIYSLFTARAGGVLVTQRYEMPGCGQVQHLVQITPAGRLLVYVGVVGFATSDTNELLAGIDALMALTQQKLQKARIQ